MPAVHLTRTTASFVLGRLGPGPVAVADVLAAGVSPGRLRAAVSAGTLVRVRHGVVAVAPGGWPRDPVATDGGLPVGHSAVRLPRPPSALSPTPRDEHLRDARAALLELGNDSVVSHASAAVLNGLPRPLLRDEPTAVWVTAPRHGRIVAGTHRRLGVVDEVDRIVLDGVLCTDVARTALDLSRRRRLPDSLVVLDAAAAAVGPDALWEACGRLRWKRDLRLLRAALDRTDALSESPLESRSRGVILLAGLPAPELQAWVQGADGRAYRVDFYWRDRRVIGEADGLVKYASLEDVRSEKRREDALRQAGFILVRWTSDELWRTPDRVLARLSRALHP
jgi:hypothetical protein